MFCGWATGGAGPSWGQPCAASRITTPAAACPHSTHVGGGSTRDGAACPVLKARGDGGLVRDESRQGLSRGAGPSQANEEWGGNSANEEEWTGGCLYLAVPSLGRLPHSNLSPNPSPNLALTLTLTLTLALTLALNQP